MLRKFLKSEDGNFAIIGSFAMLALLSGVGIVIDYTSGVSQKSQMQNALDAAAFITLKEPSGTSKSKREKILKQAYIANGGNGTARIVENLIPSADGLSLSVAADYKLPTIMMGIIGKSEIDIEVSATVTKPRIVTSTMIDLTSAKGAFDKVVTLWGRKDNTKPYSPLAKLNYTYSGNFAFTGITTTSKYEAGKWVDVSVKDCTILWKCNEKVLVGDGNADIDISGLNDLYMDMNISADKGAKFWSSDALDYITTQDSKYAENIFINGKQMKKGQKINILQGLDCSDTWIEHDWEDGGGWNHASSPLAGTDFHFRMKGGCTTTGDTVSLSK